MNAKLAAARAITAAYLGTAVFLSFTHIAALFAMLNSHATWEVWLAPIMIDGMAVIGKILMSDSFAARTRRNGKVAFMVAGAISLIANVTVGYINEQYGSALLGLIVVAAAMWAEGQLASMKLKSTVRKATPKITVNTSTLVTPAVADSIARQTGEPTAEQRAKWAEAGRKAAATRKANQAAKLEAARSGGRPVPGPRSAPEEHVPAGRYL